MKLSRRTLLAGASATAITGLSMTSKAAAPKLGLPKALKPGDKVGLIAPAGALDDQAHLDKVIEKVKSLGYEPIPMPNVLKRFGYLGGTDKERADDLNQALHDDELRAIFCIRGGYGAMRILPMLDYAKMRENPKPIIGYSDITALHLAFYAKSGVTTFHGPCGESTWGEFSRSTLPVMTDSSSFGLSKTLEPLQILVPGKAKGKIVAGNLSIVVSLLGTPYFPSLKNSILFLEDIGEDPYRVDRMLTEILLSDKSKGLKGLVFGDFRVRFKPGEVATPPDPEKSFTTEQVLFERSQAFKVPAVSRFPFGHTASNHILPLGVEAELDAEMGTVKILGKAVSS